jgi:hypothetical protein
VTINQQTTDNRQQIADSRQTDKQTNRQTDKQTNRQTDKQTNRQTDKQDSIRQAHVQVQANTPGIQTDTGAHVVAVLEATNRVHLWTVGTGDSDGHDE